MNTIYTVDYFIKKFEAKPDELWCINELRNQQGQTCALGDCRERGEFDALSELFQSNLIGFVSTTNNGNNPKYPQSTPKERILAALYDIKAKQQPEVKERIAPVCDLQKQELIEN